MSDLDDEADLDDARGDLAHDEGFDLAMSSLRDGTVADEFADQDGGLSFEYTSYVLAGMRVLTNAVRNGGDGGHGYATEVEITFDGSASVEVDVDVHDSEDEATFDMIGGTLRIRAEGCDEALCLARLLEVAGAAIRRMMEDNMRRER